MPSATKEMLFLKAFIIDLIEDLVWELEPRSRTFVERGSARIQMGLEVSDIVVGLVKKGTFIY